MSELFTDPKWQEQKVSAKKGNRIAVRMHAQLQQLHGSTHGRKCGACGFLSVRGYSNTYFKCTQARDTSSAATDWRVGWGACGLFKEAKT